MAAMRIEVLVVDELALARMIVEGHGLIHPVMSDCGDVAISFTSCREMVPVPSHDADCLLDPPRPRHDRELFGEIDHVVLDLANEFADSSA